MQISWLILITLMVVGLQWLIYHFWGLTPITYERHFRQTAVFVGEATELIETISNKGFLPLPWVKLEAVFSTGIAFSGQSELKVATGEFFQYHLSVFHLPPHVRVTRHHPIVTLQRGYHHMQAVSLSTGDLLGMGSRVMEIAPQSELYVYPQLFSYHELPPPAHSLLGDILVRRFYASDPFITAGVRNYMPGDSLRSIHWSATARTGTLVVRQEDYTADFELMIYQNMECREDMWDKIDHPDQVEVSISTAASIAIHALSQGLSVGYGTNAKLTNPSDHCILPPASGQMQESAILQLAAKLPMMIACSFATFLEQEWQKMQLMNSTTSWSHRDIILITPYVNQKITDAMELLQNLGHTVHVLLTSETAHEAIPSSEGAQKIAVLS